MSTQKKSISILSYNIHKGFSSGNVRFILHEIQSGLRTLKPDVVFLQETQGEHEKKKKAVLNWPVDPQAKFLCDGLYTHHVYAQNAIYKSGHHGNAILSNHSFSLWENINLSYTKAFSRSLLHGIVNIDDSSTKKVHLICLHLGLLESRRKVQLQRLCDRIESHVPSNEPLIVAGDFNDWRGRAEAYFYKEIGLREVFQEMNGTHAKTFPSWYPILPMDRIYYRGLTLKSCHCLSSEPWNRLSDHLPVYAEFMMNS